MCRGGVPSIPPLGPNTLGQPLDTLQLPGWHGLAGLHSLRDPSCCGGISSPYHQPEQSQGLHLPHPFQCPGRPSHQALGLVHENHGPGIDRPSNGGLPSQGSPQVGHFRRPRPRAGCSCCSAPRSPHTWPLGRVLPFSGQEMRVELLHLPADWTLALLRVCALLSLGLTQGHLSPPSTMLGEELQGPHCFPRPEAWV